MDRLGCRYVVFSFNPFCIAASRCAFAGLDADVCPLARRMFVCGGWDGGTVGALFVVSRRVMSCCVEAQGKSW